MVVLRHRLRAEYSIAGLKRKTAIFSLGDKFSLMRKRTFTKSLATPARVAPLILLNVASKVKD